MKLNVILKYVPKGKRARAHPPRHTHTERRAREAYVCVCVACGAGAKAISVLKLLHKLAVLAALPGLSTVCLFGRYYPTCHAPSPYYYIYIYYLAYYCSHGRHKAANTLPLTVAGFSGAVVGDGRGGRAVGCASCWKITLYNLCG